jgi:hypothetical protein
MNNNTKFREGYASITMTLNSEQIQLQQNPVQGLLGSMFQNERTRAAFSYDVEATDLVFSFHKPYIGRSGPFQGEAPTNPAVQTVLTGLQSLPSNMEMGIQELVDAADLSEDMLNLSVLASMDLHGVAMFDMSLAEAASKDSAAFAVQISGVVTTQAYERMWVGGLVKVAMPSQAKITANELYRGPGKKPGKITPIYVMATPSDVTSYAATLMQEYIYNNGRRSLALLRKDANMNMFANYAVSQREWALTCGIAFLYAMAERGFVPQPFIGDFAALGNPNVDVGRRGGRRGSREEEEEEEESRMEEEEEESASGRWSAGRAAGDRAEDEAAARRTAGAMANVRSMDDGRAAFGGDLAGNFGRAFFLLTPGEAGGINPEPRVSQPAEVAVFHGILSGLLGDLPRPGTRVRPAGDDAPLYSRAVQHALYVATSPAYADVRAAHKASLDRFYKLVFPHSSAGGAIALEEFGLSPFGEGRMHVARAAPTRDNPANPLANPYGYMLTQMKQAFQFATNSTENLYNFNQGLCVGRCTSGADPEGLSKECNFQFYLNL